jgi:hypothetical protein
VPASLLAFGAALVEAEPPAPDFPATPAETGVLEELPAPARSGSPSVVEPPLPAAALAGTFVPSAATGVVAAELLETQMPSLSVLPGRQAALHPTANVGILTSALGKASAAPFSGFAGSIDSPTCRGEAVPVRPTVVLGQPVFGIILELSMCSARAKFREAGGCC